MIRLKNGSITNWFEDGVPDIFYLKALVIIEDVETIQFLSDQLGDGLDVNSTMTDKIFSMNKSKFFDNDGHVFRSMTPMELLQYKIDVQGISPRKQQILDIFRIDRSN